MVDIIMILKLLCKILYYLKNAKKKKKKKNWMELTASKISSSEAKELYKKTLMH